MVDLLMRLSRPCQIILINAGLRVREFLYRRQHAPTLTRPPPAMECWNDFLLPGMWMDLERRADPRSNLKIMRRLHEFVNETPSSTCRYRPFVADEPNERASCSGQKWRTTAAADCVGSGMVTLLNVAGRCRMATSKSTFGLSKLGSWWGPTTRS